MRLGVIIQARQNSSRLPNKIMLNLAGRPVLEQITRLCRQIDGINGVVVATSKYNDNQDIVALCQDISVPYYCHTGNENDVLERYYLAAQKFEFDSVVRVTADCPLLDPTVSSQVVKDYRESGYSYYSNVHPRTYPDGLDTEVISYRLLEQCHKETMSPYNREHVTPYIYTNPQRFKFGNLTNVYNMSDHRWTLDTPDDYSFIKSVYERFPNRNFIKMEDILSCFDNTV